MDVQHNSMRVREQRHRRIEDAEKRRQYRVAHGLEEPSPQDQNQNQNQDQGQGQVKVEAGVDDQSPVAGMQGQGEFVDWEGKKKPVKKWLGIW